MARRAAAARLTWAPVAAAAAAAFLFCNAAAFRLTSATSRRRHGDMRMDDEVARKGIKEELTTRDEYLDERFRKLSQSGHDLTPMSALEVDEWRRMRWDDYGEAWSAGSDAVFLGSGQKGLYVAAVGGLPMFASGTRVDGRCTKTQLVFDEPCDHSHVVVDGAGTVRCVRSGVTVGTTIDEGRYAVDPTAVRFLLLDAPWPVESQPENFWGTEGQYVAWNNHDLSKRPLSY